MTYPQRESPERSKPAVYRLCINRGLAGDAGPGRKPLTHRAYNTFVALMWCSKTDGHRAARLTSVVSGHLK